MPSCIFLGFANVIRTQYLIPHQEDSIYIKSVFLGAVINLIVNALLIPRLQSTGAAIGTLFAEATVCVYQVFKVRNESPIKRYIKLSCPFLCIGIIMYLFLLVFTISIDNAFIKLVVKIVIDGAIYMFPTSIYFFSLKRRKII